ncbi:hypothetical protein HDU81_008879 [Chytriomyces hyalinus]|nr:hypothetical protein HDU81_008879 [Chytriomyces hyalinus]
MTSTQVANRGVGTAGAQTYAPKYLTSSWHPTQAVYLGGPPDNRWWFGHPVFGDRDIIPLGNNCYEVVAYRVGYDHSFPKWVDTDTTGSLTANASTFTESDSSTTTTATTTTTTTAIINTLTAATTRATGKSLPGEITIDSRPKFNEGVFSGTVYTDSLDNSTFVVVCAKFPAPYEGGGVNFALAGRPGGFNRILYSVYTHLFYHTISPQVLVNSHCNYCRRPGWCSTNYCAKYRSSTHWYAPARATTVLPRSPNPFSRFRRQPASLPIYIQSQNRAYTAAEELAGRSGLSVPTPAYGGGNSTSGDQQRNFSTLTLTQDSVFPQQA